RVVAVSALVVGTLVYGGIQLTRDTGRVGPKVAVIQGDFINSIDPEEAPEPHDRFKDAEKFRTYLSMIDAAAAQRPDVILLPETPWIMYLNPEVRDLFPLSRKSYAALQQRASRYGATIITGSASAIPTPNDLLAPMRRYNSATVFRPDGSEPQRYNKVHVVPFGETVPFRQGRFRFLYFWLNSLMPFSGPDGTVEYSIFPGTAFTRFELHAEGRSYRFGIPICYEDVMPYVARRFVSGGSKTKQADLLFNISNDGWFGRGIQQPQHLAICVFRAVENRVGIARAVNTGISGFVEPSGRVHDTHMQDPQDRWPGACGYAVARVGVDRRYTFYSRHGDWFAWGCAILWLIVFLDYWVLRVRERLE
ncbi:MAG: apolipoprotein N-acyltransferase, partial [Planctomycetota bacterium]